MRLALLSRRHAMQWLGCFGLVIFGWLATGSAQVAWAQTTATCNPAAGNGIGNGRGVDDPADYGAYCWIDFSGYNAAQATGGGQAFTVTLPGGATLTFTLSVDSNTLMSDNVPSWSGAAFGNSAFLNIPGNPVLYQNVNGTTTIITLSNLNLSANGSPDLPFVFVAADGESSNGGETLSFTTAGDPWQLVASPGQTNPARNMPILSGTGTSTVTETGTDGGTDGEGSYVFTTDNSPGTVSSTLVGSGLQGVTFGLKFHSIDLALTQTYSGDNFAGGTGSFQIITSNTVSPIQHPPTTPQPIQIVDTLPTGLTYVSSTGSSWTCSAVGQVVTCNLNTDADLTTSFSLPSLALNVQIASTGLGGVDTLTNTGTIKDITPGYVFDTNQNNNTGTAQVSIIHPNLSTSTKTVLDLNGGDADPGDVLEYTITLKETGGLAAANVHVTDDMPLHVGSLTITNNAACTDASTTTGGTNNTGYLDITCSSMPANGTKTIVYKVTIDNPTATGTTIDNTANIENPNGDNATAVAPTVTVKQSQVPASGNKILYVYDDLSLTRTPQTASGSYAVVDSNSSKDWTLSPVLAKPLTLNAGSTVSVNLLGQCDSINTNNNPNTCRSASQLDFTAALYDDNGGTLTQIGGTSAQASFNYISFNAVTANIAVGGSSYTVAAGHQLVLRITNTATKASRGMRVEQYSGGLKSTVSLDVSTVINVDSVGAYSDANCSTPVTLDYHAGSTVNLCAVVSDPFGSSDIAPSGGTLPGITITNPTPTQQVIGSMAYVSGADTTATRTFVYTYTVPATPVTGTWTAAVTAWEGTEHTVNRSGNGTFNVVPPSPDLSTSTKSVVDLNGGDAEPGDVLQYTITLTESVGQAATGVSVTDDMSAQVGSLTVINNAGGTDNSSTSGGANGTGKIDISGISVPANGSKTIVYNVTIAATATPGTTIDNTATVTNPNGNGAVAVAPTITVSQSQVPASGNKLLYVYDNLNLTRTPQTAGGTAVSIASQGGTQSWILSTALAKDLTIKANATISVNLLVQCANINNGACRNASDLHFTAALFDGATQIGSTSPTASFNHTSYALVTANIPIGSSAVTVLAGHQLTLTITNATTATTNSRPLLVEQYSGGNRSTVSLDVSTVINVDSVGVYTDSTCATAASASAVYETHGTVYLCAVVSDPFGSSDIDPSPDGTTPTLTITDAGSTQQLNAASMTLIADSGAATKTYQYTYTVPTSPPATLTLGGWTATVTAWEGTEHTVSDTGNTSFDVEAPNLVIVKSVSVVSNPVEGASPTAKALPGATMRYTIIITNQGKGPVDSNQLVVTDAIPTHTTFVAGSITSSESGSGLGTLAAADIRYSADGGSTWTSSPGTTVTDVKFSPTGSMLGKTGATTPTYTITFNVTIE